jgi:hypothetical protein
MPSELGRRDFPGRPWERPALTTYLPGNHSLRTERWRYTRYADGSEELYDHVEDLWEWRNLAEDPRIACLKNDARRWLPPRDGPPTVGLSTSPSGGRSVTPHEASSSPIHARAGSDRLSTRSARLGYFSAQETPIGGRHIGSRLGRSARELSPGTGRRVIQGTNLLRAAGR